MGVQDVAFLPPSYFLMIFIKHCGRGDGLGTTTCLSMSVVRVSKGMFLVKYFCSL